MRLYYILLLIFALALLGLYTVDQRMDRRADAGEFTELCREMDGYVPVREWPEEQWLKKYRGK